MICITKFDALLNMFCRDFGESERSFNNKYNGECKRREFTPTSQETREGSKGGTLYLGLEQILIFFDTFQNAFISKCMASVHPVPLEVSVTVVEV